MLLNNWRRFLCPLPRARLRRTRRGRNSARWQKSVAVWCQQLERRAMLSTLLVNNGTDTSVISELSLREAITQANVDAAAGTSDTIAFADSLGGQTITLTQGQLELSGAGAGVVTIDGTTASTPVTIDANFSSRIFQVDSGVQAVFINLMLASGTVTNDSGGTVFNLGTLSVSDTSITGSSASNAGGGGGFAGAIENEGTLSLSNLSLSNNSASSSGGALDNAGTLTVTDSTFANNSAAYGGGISNEGLLTITNTTFSQNTASTSGGGIDNSGANGNLTINGGTFSANSAAYGGAIQLYSATATTLDGVTLSNNSATTGGGSIEDYNSPVTLTNSTLNGNSAPYGGAVDIDGGGSATMSNVNLTGNTGTYGADINCNNGSLSVIGNVTLADGFGMASGTLTATGAGAFFNADVVTSLFDTNLIAQNGATISLPQATVDAYPNPNSITLSATGGGILSLPGLTSLGGPVQITVLSNSTLNVNSALTSLDGVKITWDGTGSFPIDQFTSVTNGGLTISGGTFNLPLLTDLDGSSISVSNGASLTLPNVTSTTYSYTFTGQIYSVGAYGSGSVLDMPALVSATGLDYVLAEAGGNLRLPSLTTLSIPSFAGLTATGTGSVIDLPALTSFSGPLSVLSGGTVALNPSLTTLSGAYITLDGTGSFPLDQFTEFDFGQLTIEGGSYVASALTTLYGTSVQIEGGASLTAPSLTIASSVPFNVTGLGSTLSLPALTSAALSFFTDVQGAITNLNSGFTNPDRMYVTWDGTGGFSLNQFAAFTHGRLDIKGGSLTLPALTNVNGSTIQVEGGASLTLPSLPSATSASFWATGLGSTLGLPLLTSVSGGDFADISGGVTSLNSGLTSLDGTTVRLDRPGSFPIEQFTAITHGGLTILWGSYTLAALTDLDGSSIDVTGGGSLTVPGLVSATSFSFTATGSGTVLSLPALTSVALGSVSYITISDLSGATINLNASLTSLKGARVTVDGTGSFPLNQFTSLIGGQLTIEGGSYSSSALTDIHDSSMNVKNGGQLNLPSLTSLFASAKGDTSLYVTGTGSELNLPSLNSETGSLGISFNGDSVVETDGGTIVISALSGGAITLNSSLTTLTGALINLDATGSFPLAQFNLLTDCSVTVGGASYSLPSLTNANGSYVEVDSGGSVILPSLSSVTGSGFATYDGTINLPSLLTVTEGILVSLNGGVLSYPNVTSYTNTSITTDPSGTFTLAANQIYTVTNQATRAVTTGTFEDEGTVTILSGATLVCTGSLSVDNAGVLLGAASATLTLNGNLMGNAQNSNQISLPGTATFKGNGTVASPQLLEAMSADLGNGPSGFQSNFAFGTLGLDNGTYVKLVDLSNNSGGSVPEAVYVQNLVVPVGTTLDLNGLHLYAAYEHVSGTIVGGTVVHTPVPDLVVTTITPPTNGILSGSSVNVSFVVKNDGTAATSSPVWQDWVVLSQDPTLADSYNTFVYGIQHNREILTSQPVFVAANNPSYLDAGQSYNQTVNVRLPISAQGTWYVYVVPDGTVSMEELSRANKLTISSAFTVALSPPPDLTVTNVQAPPQVFSGQPETISWTVANQGTGPTDADSWSDAVYLSPTQNFNSTTATPLGTFGHSGVLAPNGTYTQTQTVGMPVGLTGQYYVLIKTDSGSQVFENGVTSNNVGTTPSAVTLNLTPPPDLSVASVTPPATGLASHSVAFSYNVTNIGSSATPNSTWIDSFYLSPTQTYDSSTAILLGKQTHDGSLNANAGYASTVSETLPNGISGAYYLIVNTDSAGDVFELNKTNNANSSTNSIQISSNPADLVVAAATAPNNVVAGQAVRVNWTVTNQGTGDTAITNWQDNVYADTGSALTSNGILLATFTHAGLLGAGASYSQSQLATLPISQSGPYNLFVVTNEPVLIPGQPAPPPPVYESNFANDTSAPQPIAIVQQLSDLQVTQVTAPTTASSGDTVSVGWTVLNAGIAATNSNTWSDEIYLSTSATSTTGAVDLGGFQHTNALASGGQYTTSANVVIPEALAAGTYYFLVASDIKNQVYESNEFNNIAASTSAVVSLGATPDLSVSNISAPATANSGQSLTVNWTLNNAGVAVGNGTPIYSTVYFSLNLIDPNFAPISAQSLGTVSDTGGLAAGGSAPQSASFQVPTGAAGTYYIFVQVNGTNSIFERNTANNVGVGSQTVQITLPPQADLVAGAVTVPANAIPGQNTTITYQVTSNGPNAANGSWTDAVYLSPTPTWSINDPLIGLVPQTQNLAAGQSYTGTLTAPLPGVTPGAYYVIVRSNIRDNLIETTLSNNSSASLTQVSVGVPALTLGTPTTGTLAKNQLAFYQVSVDAGQTLQISFNSQTSVTSQKVVGRAESLASF